jgi:transposase-like protein
MTDTTGGSEPEVIKLDKLGRSRYSEEYRLQVLDAFEQSGMTAMAFAGQCGVKYQTFMTWLKRRRGTVVDSRVKSSSASIGPKFLLAEVREQQPAEGLQVTLPSGAVVHASCREQLPLLVELLRALA